MATEAQPPSALRGAALVPRSGDLSSRPGPLRRPGWPCRAHASYLVDSASSHMLVSKIKPCMSKYKQSIQ